MAQSVRLSRLTYVGDYLPALGVPRDDALLVTLNDGIYMLPHHAIGLHRATVDNDSSVSSTSSALTQPRPPLTASLDAQTLLRLVELSRSADASIRHAESLAHDAAVSLFGGEALTDVATLDVRALPLDDAEHSVQARQRAYVLLQTQQQWLTARASELRSRLLEQRAAVAMRNAKVEARRNALLQATVRLSAQRTGVGEGRAVLALESESLRAVRRAQHKAEARVRMLQWSLSARLLRVFMITTSSDGATLCINALRLPNSDFQRRRRGERRRGARLGVSLRVAAVALSRCATALSDATGGLALACDRRHLAGAQLRAALSALLARRRSHALRVCCVSAEQEHRAAIALAAARNHHAAPHAAESASADVGGEAMFECDAGSIESQ
jgi:hypothetical protein